MSDSQRALVSFFGWCAALAIDVLVAGYGTGWLLVRFAVESPWKERAILVTVAGTAGIAGFLLFVEASWAYVHWRRGWRVRWIAERRFAYEEFDESGWVHSIEIAYEALETGYAPPCRITVPGVTEWNNVTPAWAHGRRDAIVERLRLWGSRDGWNAPVTFVSVAQRTDGSRD